jgi:hypothetical protein
MTPYPTAATKQSTRPSIHRGIVIREGSVTAVEGTGRRVGSVEGGTGGIGRVEAGWVAV